MEVLTDVISIQEAHERKQTTRKASQRNLKQERMLQTKFSKEEMPNATQPDGKEENKAKHGINREVRENCTFHKSTTKITITSNGNQTHDRSRNRNTRNIRIRNTERRKSDRMETIKLKR